MTTPVTHARSILHRGKPIVSHAAAGFLLPHQHFLPRDVPPTPRAPAPHVAGRGGGGRGHGFPRRARRAGRIVRQAAIAAPARPMARRPGCFGQAGREDAGVVGHATERGGVEGEGQVRFRRRGGRPSFPRPIALHFALLRAPSSLQGALGSFRRVRVPRRGQFVEEGDQHRFFHQVVDDFDGDFQPVRRRRGRMVRERQQRLADMAGDIDLPQTVRDDVGVHQPLPQHPEVPAGALVRSRCRFLGSAHHVLVRVSVSFRIHGELEVLQAMVLGQIGREGAQRPRVRGGVGEHFGQRRSGRAAVQFRATHVVVGRSAAGGCRGDLVFGRQTTFVVGVPAGDGAGRSRRIFGRGRGEV